MQSWKTAVLGLLLALAAVVLWKVLSDEEPSAAHESRAELVVEGDVPAEAASVVDVSTPASGQTREVLDAVEGLAVAGLGAASARTVRLVSSLGLQLRAVNLRLENNEVVQHEVRRVGEAGMEFDLPIAGATEVGAIGHAWVPIPDAPEESVTLEPLASVVLTGFASTEAFLDLYYGHWPTEGHGEFAEVGLCQRTSLDRYAVALDPAHFLQNPRFTLRVRTAEVRAADVELDFEVRRHWQLSALELLGPGAEGPVSEGILRIVGSPPQLDVRSTFWSFRSQAPEEDAALASADRWPEGLTVTRQSFLVAGRADGALTGSGGDWRLGYRAAQGTKCTLQLLDPTTGSWIGHNWIHAGENHSETVHMWPRFHVRIAPRALAMATGEWIAVSVAQRDPSDPDGVEEGPAAFASGISAARFPLAELRSMDEASAHLPRSLEEITMFPRPLVSAAPSASGLVARAWLGGARGTPAAVGVPTVDGYFFDIEASSGEPVRMALEGSPEDLAMLEQSVGGELMFEAVDAGGSLIEGRGLVERAPEGPGLALRLFGPPPAAGSAPTLELTQYPLGPPGTSTESEYAPVDDLPPFLALSRAGWFPDPFGRERLVLLAERQGLRLEIRHTLVFERRFVGESGGGAPGRRSLGVWRWMGWGGRAPGPISQEGQEGLFHRVPTGALLEVHEGAGTGGEPASVRTYPATR